MYSSDLPKALLQGSKTMFGNLDGDQSRKDVGKVEIIGVIAQKFDVVMERFLEMAGIISWKKR